MIQLIFGLLVIGVALYFLNTYVPMQAPYKMLINILVGVCVAYWVWMVLFGDVPQFSWPHPHHHRWYY